MPSCLGLYIEDNLIKYAKVSKNNDAIKVESFGVKFYEKIGTAIKQIVEETYSFKLPISINTIEYRAFGIVASLNSNPNLTTIINPSGNSFDWHNVTRQGTSSTCTFVTGTCGNVTIKAS